VYKETPELDQTAHSVEILIYHQLFICIIMPFRIPISELCINAHNLNISQMFNEKVCLLKCVANDKTLLTVIIN